MANNRSGSPTDMALVGAVALGDKKIDDNESELLTTMRHRLSIAIGALSDSRNDELDDLRFMAGSPDNQWQWPNDVLATRGAVQGQNINARPTLTINKIPQHVKQVTNDQLQNRPSGKVIPANDEADEDLADVFNGIVRHIQYMSDADVAISTACDNQVTYGEGYIRLITDYCYENSFDQDIKIKRVRNSFSVYMDPTIQDPCGEDQKWCFITEDMLISEYEQQWPNATPISSLQSLGIGDQSISQWINEKVIRIAEYFYYDVKLETLNLYPENVTAFEGSSKDKILKSQFGSPLRQREVNRKKVCWVKTNGYEILEKTEWPGKNIPVIRVVGNEFEVEGRLYVSGIVRNAKDAQRMYNYWTSQEAEMLALAPKAPFIGYGGQFEGYENQWKTANTQSWPYLEVNADVMDGTGAVLPLPQRAQPPLAQTGLLQAKLGASEDIKNTTGQYNASLGQQSNERSGKAILARQREGDVSTYHYGDNLARAVRCMTRQLVDLIPKIYDTERIARIIGEDGETDMIKINPQQEKAVKSIKNEEGVEIEKIYNLGVGEYDVVVITGPGYATKRQEALESMAQLLQGNPQLWNAAGDLFVKNMDWPGAEELAERLKKMVDPKLLNDEDDPALQAANQQIQQMGQEMEQMHQMLQNVSKSFEMHEQQRKDFEAQIKLFDAETKRISTVQSSLSEEQIQEIVMGTVHGMLTSGELKGEIPQSPQMPIEPQESQTMTPEQPQVGV